MMFLNIDEVIEHVSLNSIIIEENENMIDVYRYFSQIVGLLIIVTNLSVVVTSGLILKKAVQPKSTYMLLGNISLADSILGVAMVITSLVDQSITTGAKLVENSDSDYISIHTLCMIIQGMRLCPAVVSILSITFIAADRYVYLIHGLYYKTWISTKRVRISIACIWITGILFTIPGWMNINNVSRCYFIDIFPPGLVLTLTAISFMNIAFVTTLYMIILAKAVNTNNKIQKAKKIAQTAFEKNKNYNLNDSSQLFDSNNINFPFKNTVHGIRLTFLDAKALDSGNTFTLDLNRNEVDTEPNYNPLELPQNDALTQQYSDDKISDISGNPTLNRSVSCFMDVKKIHNKCKENKKCRAVSVVILTTGSFIVTWVPFLVSILYFGYVCEMINTKQDCIITCQKVVKPLWALALTNSLLNPFIYAWWHHGFKNYVRSCYNKCFPKLPRKFLLRPNIDKNGSLS